MRIIHYNDEEKQLHRYLEDQGHENLILPATRDPFAVIARERFDAGFVGLHPHGLELIKALRRSNPDCLVTIITLDRDTRMAVEAMRRGAMDYLLSPLDFDQVERTCIHMVRRHDQQRRERRLEDRLAQVNNLTEFVGHSEHAERLRQRINQAAASDAPTLILGPLGSGRTHAARLIQHRSSRSDLPLVELKPNMANLRSVTKAKRSTLLLSNLHAFNAEEQAHLLRMIESSDVRIIATASDDLPARVNAERFSAELYYRINVLRIDIPPIIERREDVAPLVQHFLQFHAEREGRPPLQVAPEVWHWLEQYAWPGQAREIENICRRAIVMSDGPVFDAGLLDACAPMPLTEAAADQTLAESLGTMRSMKHAIEKRLIEQTLTDCQNNLSQTARTLGVSRTTLYKKLKDLNIRSL